MHQRSTQQHPGLNSFCTALVAACGLLTTALPAAASGETGLAVLSQTFMDLSALPTSPSATALVYDSATGANVTFTGSTPRTFMGQGFSVADPGGPVQITSMTITLVAAAAVNYTDTRINVQFWDTYNPSGATAVFSNPLGVNSFTTGPLSTAGAAGFIFTLTFATPVTLSGLSNHGLAVNWQSEGSQARLADAFADDPLLTAGLRGGGSANIAAGANATPSSGYYRNASGSTNFNFPSSDARSLNGVTNGGLVFTLNSVSAVPEPSVALMWLAGLGLASAVAARSRRIHSAC